MSIDPFPLLKRLQVGSYDNCVILTFTADLSFFEQVVFATLRSRGCYNNLVLMDSRQYTATIDAQGTQLHKLGKSYSVWPVAASKAFHPKAILQTNEKEGRLIIGSGNLTVRGYGTNWELFSEIASTDPGASAVFRDAWRLVTESAKDASWAVRRQLKQMQATSGSVLSSEGDTDWPRLLYSTPDHTSLVAQLKSIIGNAKVRRLVIVSPFFDPHLQAIKELGSAFGVKDIIAVVQPESVSFPGRLASKLKTLALHEFVAPQRSKSGYLHAKAYIIQTPAMEYCVWGSANCSSAALAGSGNYEAVLVTKGKLGHTIAALGLNASLAKSQKIADPHQLKLATQTPKPAAADLYIASAEVNRGELSVIIAPSARFAKYTKARLRLWSKNSEANELDLSRTDNVTFVGRLPRRQSESCVMCRLILDSGLGELESNTTVVHFLEELEQATPTRLQARIHRVVEAIHSGTFDWAKGLESVCELVIKISLHDEAAIADRKTSSARAGKREKANKADDPASVGDYEDFVSSVEDDEHETPDTPASTFLEEVVATLRMQIVREVMFAEVDDGGSEDHDSWRYREESERDAAESGTSESAKNELPDLEVAGVEWSRIHRAYGRLISGLNRRFIWLRGQERPIETEEFWRLDAVNLLLIDGCGRHFEPAFDLGPVLSPDEILHEYLPAISVFLGRIRTLPSSIATMGPLFARSVADISDSGVRHAIVTTCALLSGLVSHWRQAMKTTFEDESRGSWPLYTEIVAVRCLAALQRQGMLPTTEDVRSIASRSTWLTKIGPVALTEVFNDLCKLARSVTRSEAQVASARPVHSSQGFKAGDWVLVRDIGVTEVVDVLDSQVTIAMLGEPDNEVDWFHTVPIAHCVPINIPTRAGKESTNIAEELDYLHTYTDEDFEEWQDLILPQLERSYLIPLLDLAQRARSARLRSAAAEQLTRNADR
jgi:hypothetical protein